MYETTTVGGSTDAGGTDTVQSSVTWTLGSFVENLTLTGSSAINGTGNTLANTIIGNGGNNTLNGGGGNDTLTGGLGQDIFRFDTALSATTNLDTISDFNLVDDTIQLENAIFAKFLSTGSIDPTTLRAGADFKTAADSNDYLIYNTTNGALYYDADGSGTASAAIKFATLTTHPTLTAADFVIT